MILLESESERRVGNSILYSWFFKVPYYLVSFPILLLKQSLMSDSFDHISIWTKYTRNGNTVLTHRHQERLFVVCVERPLSFVVFPHDTKIPVFGPGFYDVTKVTDRLPGNYSKIFGECCETRECPSLCFRIVTSCCCISPPPLSPQFKTSMPPPSKASPPSS